jgi:hypothetical protein
MNKLQDCELCSKIFIGRKQYKVVKTFIYFIKYVVLLRFYWLTSF